MQADPDEEKLLRSVALQNARAVLLARERAEHELLQTKNELERKARELAEQREWFKVTLSSIGDAVITTDTKGRVTFLNPIAEMMTGWEAMDAMGKPLKTVFAIINETTRDPVDNPIAKVLRKGIIVGLANHTILVSKDGKRETAIEDSAAPIKDSDGKITGAVMVFHDVTEKRKAQEALRQSEERLRAMFNQAAVGIALAGLDCRFQETNRRFSEILGYSQEELYQKTFKELTYPDDLPLTETEVSRLIREEISHYGIEKRYMRKDGSNVWCLSTVTLLKNADGKPDRFIGVIEDITQRKMAEENLQETRVRLESTLNAAEIGTWTWDLKTDRLVMDKNLARMFGATEKDAAGSSVKTFLPAIHPDDLAKVEAAIAKAMESEGGLYEVDYRLPQPNGLVRWVIARGKVQRDANGEPASLPGVILDITERKLAEESVRSSDYQFRVLVDSIPQLAWMAEPDGHIFWYNRRWFDYTGTTLEEMAGWGWQKVHDPQILPQVVERWTKSINSGDPFEMEFPLRGADGVFRWFLTRVNPVRDSEGRIVRWFGTNTDVDQVRRAQQSLKEESRILELLNKTGAAIAGQLDLKGLVQTVTDAATELTGAKFGAFFYNVTNQQGESFLLYTLSGAPREAFEKFGMPRNTPIFGPTFAGQGVVRSGDITKDPRYGTMSPHHGMPKGHLPVCSYLAVPVISRSGEVIGGLFFGHPEPNVFTERSERLIVGVAAQAAVAIDNARLYESAQHELNERKRAEEAVRKGAERLELALSAGRLGSWNWDPKADRVDLTDRAADIFGLPRAIPTSWAEILKLLHEDDRGPTQLAVQKSLADRKDYNVEYRITRPSGESCWILARGLGSYEENGDVVGMSGVIQDITEKKQAEVERERLVSVLERSLNEIYMFDANTFRFQYVNEGARRNLGYSLEEMQQLTPLDLKPEFTGEAFAQMIKPLLSGEKDKHLFYTVHRRRDGTLYPVEVHLQIITHGGMRVFVAVILDITERKQLEEARFRLAAVVESSDDAILSKTLEGIITTWNKGAEQIYGYKPEEVIGKSVTVLIPPHLANEEPAIIARLKRGEKIEHYETVRMRKDGTFLDVALTVSPIKDTNGVVIGASKIARDITKRKRAELELRQAKDELEQRVQERTASLLETTEQLETFCYTVAHDLRSPLRAQQSFAQVLLDDYKNSLDDAGRGYAQRIINSAQRLDKLVNDLLAYSRISREKLVFQQVELQKVVNDLLVQLADELKAQKAVITPGPLHVVSAYEPTLNLVITNLLMNALKFMKPDVTPQIRIWSEPRENFIRLWIEDNGIGIDSEHRNKIFGVFERLHPIDKYPGTGIGLAIVQKGVERMGGTAGVESELGKGSRFWIELPAST